MLTENAVGILPETHSPSLNGGRPQSFGAIRIAIPAILLILVCLLPYLNKAYTNDDAWFLLEARQILKTPTQPMSFPICWMFNEVCLDKAGSLGAGAAQGLMGYLLVPTILAGGAEWMAHLLQILLACVAVVEMVKLSIRLGFDQLQAGVASVMLVAIPPLLPMASTAMPDVAALALGLTGMERFLAWKDDRRWQQAIAASITLGLAPYARPHFALLMPLCALWLCDEFRFKKALHQFRREAYLWAPLAAAACILTVVNLITHDHGLAHEARTTLTGQVHVARNLYAYMLYLAFPIPFAAVWVTAHWRKTPMLLFIPIVLVLIFHFTLFPSRSLAEEWPTAAAIYGLVTLVHMLVKYLRAGDRTGLLLSLWMLIPVPVVIYSHLPIKYLLAVMPAIVLILIRTLATMPRRRQLWAFGTMALLGTAYSSLLLRADADFAEYGRRAAAELIAPHVAAGEKVWYGGIIGFYWYAQQAGATISKPGVPGPNPGELLAVGLTEWGYSARNRFPNRELIDSRSYDSPHGRTMGYGGGLYSNAFGDALWVWNPKATNTYELWRVH